MTLKEFLAAIADAIRGKEGSTEDIPAPEFPQRIEAIQTGVTLPTLTNPGAAADLRQGKQLIDQSGAVVDGTLVEVEQATPSISVSSAGLITATAGDKSATKQLTTRSGETIRPSTSEQVAVGSGVYSTGTVWVEGDADLVPENIKRGVQIFGVQGTLDGSGGTWEIVFFTDDPEYSSDSIIASVENNLNQHFGELAITFNEAISECKFMSLTGTDADYLMNRVAIFPVHESYDTMNDLGGFYYFVSDDEEFWDPYLSASQSYSAITRKLYVKANTSSTNMWPQEIEYVYGYVAIKRA